MLFELKQKKFCNPEHREDNSHNLHMGQSKFRYELTFWFIITENGGKQKSKKYIESIYQSIM